jgi:hypothetical protein
MIQAFAYLLPDSKFAILMSRQSAKYWVDCDKKPRYGGFGGISVLCQFARGQTPLPVTVDFV